MAFLELQHIQKSFEDQHVLRDVNISIERGEFITLLGPSGCGKTTLLRIISGLEKLDGGTVLVNGQDKTFAEPKERDISMIFQQYSLFPTMTVYNNIAFGLKMKKVDKAEIARKIARALEMVNLSGSEKKYPSQLSGGEQQRVALARAIVTDARILLLDEPFSAIDAKLRKALQIQIKEIHNELGLTTIFVTHDQDEAMRMSDRIYLMNKGRVEQEGSPMDLYLNPKSPYVASFMGHYNLFDEDGYWAIRPEAIELSASDWSAREAGYVYGQGAVHRIMAQGNISRITVQTAERLIDVDVLYQGAERFELGQQVFFRYPESEVRSW